MRMQTLFFGVLMTASTAIGPALADPIVVRQALMSSNGSAGALAAAMMKGEIPYSPTAGRSVIASLHATSLAFGDFFPEGSEDTERSIAAPAIWEDPEGFQAELTAFQKATAAAAEISGKDGPADMAAFQSAMGPVFDSCKTCHEDYRIKR